MSSLFFRFSLNINHTEMLEYVKTILRKVSFDAKLFEKELRKAMVTLVQSELAELKDWCYENFGNIHRPVLERCFVST